MSQRLPAARTHTHFRSGSIASYWEFPPDGHVCARVGRGAPAANTRHASSSVCARAAREGAGDMAAAAGWARAALEERVKMAAGARAISAGPQAT